MAVGGNRHAEVPRSARNIVSIIASMLVVSIVTMWLIPIDQVVTAQELSSLNHSILVQPLETAIIRSIDVREGQEVHTGQLLARLTLLFPMRIQLRSLRKFRASRPRSRALKPSPRASPLAIRDPIHIG